MGQEVVEMSLIFPLRETDNLLECKILKQVLDQIKEKDTLHKWMDIQIVL